MASKQSALTFDTQDLCMALIRADTEAQVIALLSDAELWDGPSGWRDLGDDDNNFATIGNQQSEAIAALIEKLINSVDSRLLNACRMAGIDPTSSAAPQTIREAVAQLFEGRKLKSVGDKDGRVAFWDNDKIKEEGLLLTIVATGNMPDSGWPCLTVADQGEGQTPDDFPNTFMSLHRSNKLRIPFVQGKFNMGGTGVFQFCDTKARVQLVVSRRNPELLGTDASPRDREWGFTVVRRQAPADGRRSSVFTYLAPVAAGADRKGGVLSFAAETLPIFPEADAKMRDAYYRHAPHGALVKMYEYKWQGTRSNVVYSGDNLLRRLDQGLPEIALPVRIFECRPGYRGAAGSFATNVLGLAARLERDRAEKLEQGFPKGAVIDIGGSKVRVRIFAFTKDSAPEYRTARNGVIFTINGQAHASMPIDFFRRQSVGMSYLADSLLVTLDCSAIQGETREDLFMNSRDRLRENAISAGLVKQLSDEIKGDPALRALWNKRRREDLAEKLADSKPLADVLGDLVRRSPLLAKLFMSGMKVPSPFPPGSGVAGTSGNGHGSGGGNTHTAEFKGKEYPTFFRFKGLDSGEEYRRQGWLGHGARVVFETDAENAYFVRDLFPGDWKVWRILGDGSHVAVEGTRMGGPSSGVATLHINVPDDVPVGAMATFDIEVTDDMRIDPFVSRLVLEVREGNAGGGGGPKKDSKGGNGGGGLALPEIKTVHEQEWDKYSFHTFTEDSALVIVNAGTDDETDPGGDVFDFYVNVDNKHLRTAQKESKEEPKLLEAKFTYSLVLMGLALINEARGHQNPAEDKNEPESVDSFVARATAALAPVLLPMVDTIGGMSLTEQ